MGFNVKLDTNGANPDALKKSLPYLDYVAMDIKTSFGRYPYSSKEIFSSIKESIRILMDSDVKYEFRTVMCPIMVNTGNFNEVLDLIRNADRYRMTTYYPENAWEESFRDNHVYSKSAMIYLANITKDYGIKEVYIDNESGGHLPL